MLGVIPFPDYPLKIPNPVPYPPAHQSTNSCFTVLAFPYPGTLSLHWTKGLSPIDFQQGHLLLHMQLEPWVPPLYSLVGGLVPGSSWNIGWFILLSMQTFSSLGPSHFFRSSIWDPVLRPMVGWEHPPHVLFEMCYLSGTGRASQEMAMSISCQ